MVGTIICEVGTIICEVSTIICDIGTINMRFYLLEVRYPHGYRRITHYIYITEEVKSSFLSFSYLIRSLLHVEFSKSFLFKSEKS